ncbi:MAG: MSCRAMM family protein, partial [Terriglobales bacterium]
WRVKLEIGDVEPKAVFEVTTSGDGSYVFSDLPGGDYHLSLPCQGQPSWWVSTDMMDHSGVLDPGASQEDQDLLVKLVSAPKYDSTLEGRVTLDEDGDALPESSEPGVADWTISATIQNSSVCASETVTAVSTSDGSFSLSHLLAGTYYVLAVAPPHNPAAAHWALDAPGGPIDCGNYQCFQPSYYVDVPPGGGASVNYSVLALDGTSSLSGSIYRDQNENGSRDPDDPLLDNGYQIGLLFSTPHGYSVVSPDTFTSAPGGRYQISNLLAGDYSVGCLFGPGGPPINPPIGPNSFPERLVTLRAGQTTTADFGFGPQPPEPTEGPPPLETPSAEPASTAMPSAEATPAFASVGPPSTGDAPPRGNDHGARALLVLGSALLVGGLVSLRRKGTVR